MPSPSKILIVDDQQRGREALEELLLAPEYEFAFAGDGAEALRQAAHLLPDLILLDVMMPGMDGFEVCRRLRATPRLAEVPVLIITALDDQQSLLQGFAAGADDFISKPFNRIELRARVKTITRLNRFRTLWAERDKLEASYQELQRLSQRLVEVQEFERRALANDLHDEIGQNLTAIKLLLEGETLLPVEAFHPQVAQARALVKELIQQVRELSLKLRPAMLDEVGLFLTLQWLCERFEQQTHIQVQTDFDPLNWQRFPPPVEIAAFRIVQEALTNVARYAQVSEVVVGAQVTGAGLRLHVKDLGLGFNVENPTPGRYSNGLVSLRERARSARGQLSIHTAPGNGTTVEVVFPLQGASHVEH